MLPNQRATMAKIGALLPWEHLALPERTVAVAPDPRPEIAVCLACHSNCFLMACRMVGLGHARQAAILLDTAEFSRLLADLIQRNAPSRKNMAHLCARSCRISGSICTQHSHELADRCASVCLECAEACRSVISETG